MVIFIPVSDIPMHWGMAVIEYKKNFPSFDIQKLNSLSSSLSSSSHADNTEFPGSLSPSIPIFW